MNLREVKTLRKLNHTNVVKLKEVIRVQNDLYLVFEHMKGTILDSLKENHRYRGTLGLPNDVVKSVVLQCLQGLEYVHSKSFIHRDLKPENLLFSDGQLKIADFGLSKEYISYREQHTNYVSTRWYRAPELMLRAKAYDVRIDIFALGCIMAELYTGQPLFPGQTESDMLYRIANVLGNIPESWKSGYETAYRTGSSQLPGALTNPSKDQVIQKLQYLIPQASSSAIDLIYQMI